jgi:hypothetical protein
MPTIRYATFDHAFAGSTAQAQRCASHQSTFGRRTSESPYHGQPGSRWTAGRTAYRAGGGWVTGPGSCHTSVWGWNAFHANQYASVTSTSAGAS